MEPELIGLSALIQRISVDFPEPEGPMMHTTSPLWTVIDTPLMTSSSPKDLCTSVITMMGSPRGWVVMGRSLEFDRHAAFQPDGDARDRIAVSEEQHEGEAVEGDQQFGLVVFGAHGLTRQGDDLLDPQKRAQRRGHRQDRVPVHPGWDHPLEALRQDDLVEGLTTVEAKRFRGLTLP